MTMRLLLSRRSARPAGMLLHLVAALCGAFAMAAAQAQPERPAGGGLRLSGFGTLGLSHVQAPEGWGFRRELTQPGDDARWRGDVDTRLGVQLNYNAGPALELVAQAIAKKRGAYAKEADALEWAYASYRPSADWALRAGRVNVDAFLMADYRNVGYGYLPVRPPMELYARLPTTLDGGDVARSWLWGDAQWRAKLFAGRTRIGDVAFSEAFRLNGVLGGMVSREEGGWLLRASYARSRIHFDQSGSQQALAVLDQLAGLPIPGVAQPAAALRQRLAANGIRSEFAEMGVRYEGLEWQWSAEFVRVTARPLTIDNTVYMTLGRRMGDWTPFVGVGHARNSVPVLQAPAWQPLLAPVLGPVGAMQAQLLGDEATRVLNGGRMEQSSWSVGARWDFHPQAALKLQWDRIRTPQGGSSLWTNAMGAPGRARVATAVVDFIF
jgi:hypothetical protein